MTTHNPETVIHLLRDHLASHDKRLAFLFGAGTSSAVNVAPEAKPGEKQSFEPLVPAIELMTKECQDAVDRISSAHSSAWQSLVDECEDLDEKPNIESILGRLRLKVDAAGPADKTLGLDRQQLESLEAAIRTTIAKLASPDESVIPERVPHDEFANWIRRARRQHPIEIFTTNYDVLIERSLERARVPFFDGFIGSHRPYFSPDTVEVDANIPGRKWTRLWKLHGSANWSLIDNVATRLSDLHHGDMILPSQRKYDESRKMPYLALMDRLASSLSTDGTLIVTCGYSWNDQHINSTILTALDTHPSNAVVALSYAELDEVPDLVELAAHRKNFIVIGPRTGVVRGQRKEWALPQTISKPTASFLDHSFDSDALPEQDGGPITGSMRLVDFNEFCRFLAAMDTEETV